MGIFDRGNKDKSVYKPEADRRPQHDQLPAYMTGAVIPGDEVGVDLSKAAKISLLKYPKLAREWALYKASDVSYSMSDFIRNGDLDYLTEAICTVSFENGWDSDNIVPAFPYGRNVAPVPHLLRLGQHAGSGFAIANHADAYGVDRGGTAFDPAVRAIFAHYRDSEDFGKRPAIAFFQTDGLNFDMSALAASLTNYSGAPIHWVFIYYGPVDLSGQGRDNAANLRKLDDGSIMPGRVVDNVSVFIAGPEPKKVTPMELYNGLLRGPNQWVMDAQQAGIL